MLYFDNAYPLKMGWWDARYSLLRPGWKSLERKAKNELVPPENGMSKGKITENATTTTALQTDHGRGWGAGVNTGSGH
jgi:hypothetical protein